jgi:hypothetical protein
MELWPHSRLLSAKSTPIVPVGLRGATCSSEWFLK